MRQVRRLVEVVAQEVEGRRRIPLRGAYKASQHTAVAADDEGGRQALESKAAPQLALGVQVDRQVLEIEAREERTDHRLAAAVLRDRQDSEPPVRQGQMQALQRRPLLPAGAAPGGTDVEERRSAG